MSIKPIYIVLGIAGAAVGGILLFNKDSEPYLFEKGFFLNTYNINDASTKKPTIAVGKEDIVVGRKTPFSVEKASFAISTGGTNGIKFGSWKNDKSIKSTVDLESGYYIAKLPVKIDLPVDIAEKIRGGFFKQGFVVTVRIEDADGNVGAKTFMLNEYGVAIATDIALNNAKPPPSKS